MTASGYLAHMASFPAPKIGPYELKGVIGQGAFSAVHLATVIDEGGNEVNLACKIVPRSSLAKPELDSRFENEIRITQQLRHPGVVQIVDLLKDDENYYIMMEFCEGGELFRFIVLRQRLREPEAKMFMKQILVALRHVHNVGVCHRDLKPENILLDVVGKVKISDFGLGRFVNANGLVSTPCGSPCYASPECISGKPYDGRKSDIWSAGVILYAMLTGQLPWTKRNQQQLFEQIRKGEYTIPAYLSEQCMSLIRGLMTVDCEKRLTIDEALKHPWLASDRGLPFEPPRFIITPSIRRIDRFFDREVSTTSVLMARGVLPMNKTTKNLTFEELEQIIKSDEDSRIMLRARQRGAMQVVRRLRYVNRTSEKLA